MSTGQITKTAEHAANRGVASAFAVFAVVTGLTFTAAHADEHTPQIVAVAPGIHMIVGRGGNVGVASGSERTFVIDDQYAGVAESLQRAIAEITQVPVTFLLNTHYHNDHTGGNELFGESGAMIVAHDNVRRRISKEQFIEFLDMRAAAAAPAGLPVITFEHSVSFHLNGDEIHVVHMPFAHTDGDAIVHFRRANVIHAGDVYFNGLYPFIDYGAGGSIEGVIVAVDHILALADENTRIIPGHGPLGDAASLRVYRDMLADVAERIGVAVRSGLSLDELQASRPTAAHDAQWGAGFLPPARWVQMIYDGMRMRARTGNRVRND